MRTLFLAKLNEKQLRYHFRLPRCSDSFVNVRIKSNQKRQVTPVSFSNLANYPLLNFPDAVPANWSNPVNFNPVNGAYKAKYNVGHV